MTTKPTLLLLMALALPLGGFAAEAAPDAASDVEAAATAAAAEEADADAEEADASRAEDPIVAEAESSSGSTTPAQDDTFVPSVQISEDLSVSFPADI